MNKKLIINIFLISSLFLLSGCSIKNSEILNNQKIMMEEKIVRNVEPLILPYDDVVNMGQYAQAWIAPYKDNGILYNERGIYFWIYQPTFINGEELPLKKDQITYQKKKFVNLDVGGDEPRQKNIQLNKKILNFVNKGK